MMASIKPQFHTSGSFILNRADSTRRDDDNVKTVSIGIIDIDHAIRYYFDNIIKPVVKENDELISVPVVYGSPERWKAIQKDGYYRDKNGQLLCPLIVYRRTGIAKKRNYSRNLDPNYPKLFIPLEKQYTPRNNYDQFSVLTNVKPQREFYNVIVPDWIELTYECMIWTNYLEQMNKIVEAINYAESSYWGEPEAFKFYTVINNYTEAVELEAGEDRHVTTTFNMAIHGYIVPDAMQAEIKQNSQKSFSVCKVVMSENLSDFDIEGEVTTTYGSDEEDGSMIDIAVLTYLRTETLVIADNITVPTTATFSNNSMLLAPIGLTSTSKDDFTFFLNGVLIPNNMITSFTQVGNNLVLVINNVALGYDFEVDSVVAGIGKFAHA